MRLMDKQPRPSIRLASVNLDCADAEAMATFYGRLLGWEVTYRDHDFIAMQDPGGGICPINLTWPPRGNLNGSRTHRTESVEVRVL